MWVRAFIAATAIFLTACEFQKQADAKFGDQHFKTAISLIELHKLRFGKYPEKLGELKYVGDWDQLALVSVEYHRLDKGYELNLKRGWIGKPDISYPEEFWKGLGLSKSNMK